MKTTIAILALSISAQVMAAAKPLKPCSADEVKVIMKDIKTKKTEGMPFASLMKNKAGKTVGFFVSDNDMDIYAEVCEYMPWEEMDLTTTNLWYYWESKFKANTATWTVGTNYQLMQDEGLANIKLLAPSKTGNVKVEFSVQGWNEESEVKVMRKEILSFSPVK